ncbi:LacI family transcriptional regulator [Celeribacter neptunius]|uniref:Transcriptional regulator, LacI family n=1 Tax=Celeribacter neptunius TaxID=588602 RepID=A0A1I3LU90_9RHOB|nr:LacI family transcriptional regulator [Celeribacter neptunius]SFI88354.1 transcriptional regulator, LacI family [Celeribacter neptunius]
MEDAPRPTLKTIAQITGLTIATVSRALNDAPDIAQRTKVRVRAVADQIGYLPNRAGQRLRTGKTHVISLLLTTEPDIMNHTAQLISAVAEGLTGTGYHLVVTPYAPRGDLMAPLKMIVDTQSADAVILNQTRREDPRVAYLMEKRFPFATHGRTIWAEDHPWCDFDNHGFAALGMEALAHRGRKQVMLIAPPADQFYGMEVRHGAKEAAAKYGLTLVPIVGVTSDSPAAQITEAVQSLLATHPEIDGILCASPMGAIAAINAAEALGRRLAQDIDVFAKEALPLLRQFRPETLALHEDVIRAGDGLARAAIRAIDTPDLRPLQDLHPARYDDPMGAPPQC